MGAAGTTIADFGPAPGSSRTSPGVAAAGIAANSHVEAWFQGNDATADHNEAEHQLMGLYSAATVIAIAPGSDFDLEIITELRLTGTFILHWVWS